MDPLFAIAAIAVILVLGALIVRSALRTLDQGFPEKSRTRASTPTAARVPARPAAPPAPGSRRT